MDNFEILYRSGMMSKQTINGTPPLTFTSDGSPLSDYTIYGYTSPNLFDASATLVDSGIDRDTGEIVESSGSSTSDWILYDSEKSLFISGQRTVAAVTSIIFAFYDSEKKYIDWVGVAFSSGRHSYEVTEIPDSAAFFRVQFFDDGFSNVMINQGDSALPYEPFGAVGERTENSLEILPQYLLAENWEMIQHTDRKYYFMYTAIPNEIAEMLKQEITISGKVFLKQGGIYFNGMVFVITPIKESTVGVEYRILQNNGNVLDYSADVSSWENIYLGLGYGRGIPTIGKQTLIDSLFDNYNISLISGTESPDDFEPYGYKIPITCGGETTNIYLDSPLYEGDSISLSTAGVEIPTVEGENTLTVGTTVQPSAVEIKAVKSAALSKADRYFQYLYDVARNRR